MLLFNTYSNGTYSTSYKEIKLYARRTGADVLHTTDGHATGTDTGVSSATFSNRMVVFVFVQRDNSECQYVLE